jgi:hypothetical protein
MIKNNFYPLRTIVGSSIPIQAIIPYPKVTSPFHIVIRDHPTITDAVFDDVYSNFLPDIIKGGVTYQPIPGMNTMPVPDSNILPFDNISSQSLLNLLKNPSDIPFSFTDSVASLYGFRESFVELELNSQVEDNQELKNHFYSGRDRIYSFLVLLEKETLVGGMCFQGYPYISSRIENTVEGMTIGNFGLPREFRLTPLPSFVGSTIEELTGFQRSQFIDAEFAYTRQEILSHSGLNYLTVDPVKTNLFLLTLTDLPFIPRIIDLDTNKDDLQKPLRIEGFKGFAIPYIWFFEYKEQTKRNARLHSGILGVKPGYPHLPKEDGDNTAEDILRRAFPEWEYYFLDGYGINPKYTEQEIIEEIAREEEALLEGDPNNQQLIDNIEALQATLQEIRNAEDQTGVYWVYTAHSALGQRRQFQFSYANLNYSDEVKALPAIKNRKNLEECFVSDLLQPNEKIILYLQQGEEFERCVAGLKTLFLLVPDDDETASFAEHLLSFSGITNHNHQLSDDERTFVEDVLAFYLSLPPETNFCEEFRLKIYEIDPIEGVSPASVDLNSKYATLLADVTVNDFLDVVFSQLLKGIPFRKVSSSKYFALEFTNTGVQAGQIAIHSLQMIRSANVSVQPRAAKSQQIKALHYRIIGPELADDFSKLGNEGFNFSIDRVTAGQTKNVLYSAMSLLDLLHTGAAKLQSNVRRRAIEFEMVENYREQNDSQDEYIVKKILGDNFSRINEDNRITEGWRRTETGEGVSWNSSRHRPQDYPSSLNESAFENYGTIENRIHNSLLFPDTSNVDWATVSALGNMLKIITDPTQGLQTIINQFNNGGISNLRAFIDNLVPDGLLIKSYRASAVANSNKEQLVKGFERIWKGISTSASNLRVNGIISSSQSPVGLSAIAGNLIGDVISTLDNLSETASDLQDLLHDGDVTKIGELMTDLSGLLDLVVLLGSLSIPSAGGQVSPLAMIPLLNGLTLGLTSGVGVNIGSGPNLIYPSYQMTANSGSTGSINKSATKTGYSYNQQLNVGFDNVQYDESELKRIVTRRELSDRDNERVRGAEILWQDKIQDIITGSIPLNFILPATATKISFRTADDSLRVRFNSGFSPSIQVDFWFELTEETIKDDN